MKKEHCMLFLFFLLLYAISIAGINKRSKITMVEENCIKLWNYQKNLENCLKVALLEVGFQLLRKQLNFKNRDSLIYKMKKCIADLFPKACITQYQKLGDVQ